MRQNTREQRRKARDLAGRRGNLMTAGAFVLPQHETWKDGTFGDDGPQPEPLVLYGLLTAGDVRELERRRAKLTQSTSYRGCR